MHTMVSNEGMLFFSFFSYWFSSELFYTPFVI